MGDGHLSVGERGVAMMPGAVGFGPVRVSGSGSGVSVGLGRVQALAVIGVVAALTVGLLMGLASPAGAVAGYGDVGEGTWYTDAVQWSTDNGIADIAGPCFGPDTPVSRGETAVWIYNMENRPDAGDRHSFTDVTDASQHDAISWMANTGITTGTSPTTFAPDETLKRAQAAAFLHRLAGEPAAPAHSFVDVVTAWQQGGVSWMAHTGITTGTSPTTFAPDDTLTRAHLVTFLYRYQGEPEVTVNTTSPDCDSDAEPDPTPQGAFTAIAAGGSHSCGLRTDGTAQCWGLNYHGRTDAPSGAFTAITAGGSHSCGLRTDGTAQCWGYDDFGQTDAPTGTFTAITAGKSHDAITGGKTHSCGLRTDGTAQCWGWNSDGQADAPTGTFTAVTAGGRHSCGLRTDGTAQCWGYDDFGQADAPSGVFTAISAGTWHSCGLRTDGTAQCWGYDDFGQADAPSGVFTAISAGTWHSCGLGLRRLRSSRRTDGTAQCWGYDDFGQADAPTGAFTAISVGGGYSCGIRTDGTAQCWGRVGDRTSTVKQMRPQVRSPPSQSRRELFVRDQNRRHRPMLGLQQRSSRCAFRCVYRYHSRRGPFVWAQNRRHRPMLGLRLSRCAFRCVYRYHSRRGRLGRGRLRCRRCRPIRVGSEPTAPPNAGARTVGAYGGRPGGPGASQVGDGTDSPTGDHSRRRRPCACRGWYSCGLRTDGTAQCWGNNNNGQTDAPTGAFTAITVGWGHSCGLRTDGTAQCWGNNNNSRAGGGSWGRVGQTDAPSGAFTAITVGWGHSCGLRADGTAQCWGRNSYGQTDAPSGAFTVEAITANWLHSCGLRADGTAQCWGWNSDGQADAPTGTFTAITAGQNHSCGLRTDGTAQCWDWTTNLPEGVTWVS